MTARSRTRPNAPPIRGEIHVLSFSAVTLRLGLIDRSLLPARDEVLDLEVIAPEGFYRGEGHFLGSSRPGEIRIQITGTPQREERRGLLRIDWNIPVSVTHVGNDEPTPAQANAIVACQDLLPKLRIQGCPELAMVTVSATNDPHIVPMM